jgi:hypothetical protein
VTAEHEDRAGGEHGGAGPDALMAAITDERLSDESVADAAFMAEYRSATADLAVLREQLGLVAGTLVADTPTQPSREPAAEPPPAPVRRLPAPRRRRPLALRAVGVAAAGALVLGAGWVVVQVGHGVNGGADDKASARDASAAEAEGGDAGAKASSGVGSPLRDPGYLACARLVVEGDVTDVRRLPGTARERVTLSVTHAYKPAKSAPQVDFVVEEGMDPLLDKGDHVLVALAKGAGTPEVWAVGESEIATEREALTETLPDTTGVACE